MRIFVLCCTLTAVTAAMGVLWNLPIREHIRLEDLHACIRERPPQKRVLSVRFGVSSFGDIDRLHRLEYMLICPGLPRPIARGKMEIKGKEAKDTYRTSYVFHLPDIPLESIEKYRKDAIQIEIRLDGMPLGTYRVKMPSFRQE